MLQMLLEKSNAIARLLFHRVQDSMWPLFIDHCTEQRLRNPSPYKTSVSVFSCLLSFNREKHFSQRIIFSYIALKINEIRSKWKKIPSMMQSF